MRLPMLCAGTVLLAGCTATASPPPAPSQPSPVPLGAEQAAAVEAMRSVHDSQLADGSYEALRNIAVGASAALAASGYAPAPAPDSMLSATAAGSPPDAKWGTATLHDAGLDTTIATYGPVHISPASDGTLWKVSLSGGADPSVCVTFADSRTFAYTVASSQCPQDQQVRAQQTLFQLTSAASQVAHQSASPTPSGP